MSFAYYNEFDPNAAAWLRELIKRGLITDGEVDERSVLEVQPEDLKGFVRHHFFAGIGVWDYALQGAGFPADRRVLTASLPCFPAEVSVITARGVVPIPEVVVGDEVLTHNQRFRKVTAIGNHLAANLVLVKGQGHHGLVCTEEHPFLTMKQKIDHRRKSPTYQKTLLHDEGWTPAKDLAGLRWAGVSTVPETTIPVLPDLGENLRATNSSIDFTALTTARYLGFWVGNGWANVKEGNVTICDGYQSRALLEDVAKTAGLNGTFQDERTNIKYRVSFKPFAAWLLDNFGSSAVTKRLPVWVFGMPDEWRQQFLHGWFEADGHLGYAPKGGAINRVWTTASKELAIGLRILLNQQQLGVSIKHTKPQEDKMIEGRKVAERGWYQVTAYENSRSLQFLEGRPWGRVRSVTPVVEQAQVYNLAVEEDESYTADGIFVHNCQPFSSAGAQKGKADERHLLPHFLELIARCDMPLMFGEQVEAAIKHSWLDELHDSLPDYEVATNIIPAAAVGAPHIRSRLWWVATKHDTSRTNEQAVRNNFTAGERDLQAYAQRNQDTSGTHSGQNISGGEERTATGLVDTSNLRDVRRPCEKCKQVRRQERPDVYEPVGSKCLPCRVSDMQREGREGRLSGWPDSERRTVNGHLGCDSAVSRLGDTNGATSERHTRGLHSSQGEVDGEDRSQDGSCSFRLTDAGAAGSGMGDSGSNGHATDTLGRGTCEGEAESGVCELEGSSAHSRNTDVRNTGSRLGDTEHDGCSANSQRSGDVQPSAERRENGQDIPRESEGAGGRTESAVLPRRFIGRETWSDNIVWLYCRDEKYRPIERSIAPLVTSSAGRMGRGSDSSLPFDANNTAEARVMRLKGYGNAINSVVAKTFIEAFLGVEQ